MNEIALKYYAQPGILTDPGEYASWLSELPCDIPALCKIVQGLMVHIFWAEHYGLELTEERKQEVNIRPVSQKLARILELDGRSLAQARPPEKKLVGNCRDFSILLCSLLRYQGVPARARCGFGAYFLPNHYEDHWVCEYWNPQYERWMMVDSQLDDLQQRTLQIDFDPLDVPHEQFWTGGKAWQTCRAGQANPDDFGIFDMHGMWFIRGDLVRDFLALNKIEILPWDHWGLMSLSDEELSEDDLVLSDRIAVLNQTGDEAFDEIRALYKHEERLRLPAGWQI